MNIDSITKDNPSNTTPDACSNHDACTPLLYRLLGIITSTLLQSVVIIFLPRVGEHGPIIIIIIIIVVVDHDRGRLDVVQILVGISAATDQVANI